jgi:hypothetical protein
LSNPTNGLIIGNPGTTTVSVLGYTTPGPQVTSLRLLPSRGPITSIVLTFSEPLIPSRAVNLLNYGYSVQASPNVIDGITSASYDAANDSVTLRLQKPIYTQTPFHLSINQATDTASSPVGVADTSGNLLDGNYDGVPGGVFNATFVRGQKVTYFDSSGDRVTLRLSGPGTVDLTRHADGSPWQIVLSGAVPGRSKLTGQIQRPSAGAAGPATLPPIIGASGVRVVLKGGPFVVRSPSASRAKLVKAPRQDASAHRFPGGPMARPSAARRGAAGRRRLV